MTYFATLKGINIGQIIKGQSNVKYHRFVNDSVDHKIN